MARRFVDNAQTSLYASFCRLLGVEERVRFPLRDKEVTTRQYQDRIKEREKKENDVDECAWEVEGNTRASLELQDF